MSTKKKIIIDIAALASRRNDKEIMMMVRRRLSDLRKEEPDFAKELTRTISSAGGLGALRRFQDLNGTLVDSDSGMELVTVEEPNPSIESPILDSGVRVALDRFIRERHHVLELQTAGVRPPTSLALMGPPGTGKTTLARWIGSQLDLPFMVVDLASVVTSYLGHTGQNIKKILDRARLEPSVLLLDEFDALGRIRTENSDVGEMKRVVTVLLQGIDDWPDHSVIMAATNLPELVDHAFRRRFSRWLRLALPDVEARQRIFNAHYRGRGLTKKHLKLAALCLKGASGADIANVANRVMSRQVLDKETPTEALWAEISQEISERDLPLAIKKKFIKAARNFDSKRFSYRKLANIVGISHTTAAKLGKE